MVRNDGSLFYYSCLLFCFLIFNSTASSSQTKTAADSFERELTSINKKVLDQAQGSATKPCTIAANLSIENLLQQVLTNDSWIDWQCSKIILNKVREKEAVSELERCHLNLALAQYFTSHQRYDSANSYAMLANKEAAEHGWKNERVQALLLLSNSGLKRRNISFAYLWADSALTISRQLSNENLEAKSLLQLALCARRHFTASGNRSFSYFLTAREKALSTADSSTLSAIDLYLGTDYFELNKWVEGYGYFKEGMAISLGSGSYQQVYLAHIALGYAYQLANHLDKALPLFIKALSLSKNYEAPYNVQHCYHDISRSYEGLHQYDSALKYANMAANVNGVDSFWANVWDTKADIYNEIGDYKNATVMYKKSIEWFREDFLYRNQDQLSGYEAKFNTQEKELQVTKEKRRRLQLEWMMGGIGGLLIMAGWAFTVQRNARQKLIQQNKLIQKQRSELEKSLGEKEILLKEIHHRVKNNLSVISSLLELQSSGLQDETARAAIAVGQNRVASIGLIHQRLYQHENLAAIEFNGFIRELLPQISSVFSKPGIVVRNLIDVPETLLDIDTAIPLGLIMNELLTNSHKYAFNQGKEGLIKINLKQLSPGDFLLTYTDNGPGIGSGFEISNSSSLGLRLIKKLSKQLGGRATYEHKEGSCFKISFKDTLARNQDS